MKVKTGVPRKLTKQHAWYYLPYGADQTVSIYREQMGTESIIEVKIPAQKLLRELLAAGVKP